MVGVFVVGWVVVISNLAFAHPCQRLWTVDGTKLCGLSDDLLMPQRCGAAR